MPEELDKYINREKNRLASPGAWLWLLEIEIDGADTLYFVNNIENISYQGQVYSKCNFQMDPYNKSEPGRLSSVNLSITNADLVNLILPYVDDYDGLIGQTITRTPVNSKWLNIDMSAKAEEFLVTGCSAGEEWIAFVLGAPSPLNRKFPDKRYFGHYCRYRKNFKGIECGYSGAETTCNGTPEDCEDRSNLARFGGQLGLRSNTVRFA
jgi:phage-related protein